MNSAAYSDYHSFALTILSVMLVIAVYILAKASRHFIEIGLAYNGKFGSCAHHRAPVAPF